MADLQASNEIASQTVAEREAAIGEAHGRLIEAEQKRDAFGNQVQSCLLILHVCEVQQVRAAHRDARACPTTDILQFFTNKARVGSRGA
jgi:hypothetical protein